MLSKKNFPYAKTLTRKFLGAIEEAISSHPAVAECCVIGVPDEMKGHLPFAFVVTFTPQEESKLFTEIQKEVRSQQGSISSLGGMICGKQGDNLIPKTRSGKMLRRNLRELVEAVVEGEPGRQVHAPAVSWSMFEDLLRCVC